MKILFLIAALRSGGAERVASTLCNHWADIGNDVTLVTLDAKQNDFYRSSANIHRYALNSFKTDKNIFNKIKSNLIRIVRIRKIIKKVKPDVVVAFMDVSNVLSVVACLGTGIPVVISERTYPPYFHNLDFFDRMRRLVYKFSDAFVAQTQQISTWAQSFLGEKKPIRVIANPISEKILQHSGMQIKNNTILGVGRIDYNKGFDRLVEAFNLCHEHFPEWQINIIGDGIERKNLQQQINSYGLNCKVKIIGQIESPQDYYATAKIFVLSSRVEGFPNVLIEAMANGLAVASFDCNCGPAEIIENEVNGLLVADNQIDALALAMQRLMADGKLREDLGKEAVKIRGRYLVDNVAKQWLDLFKQVARKSCN